MVNYSPSHLLPLSAASVTFRQQVHSHLNGAAMPRAAAISLKVIRRTDALNIGARLVGEQKGFQRVTGYANYYADHTGDRRTKEQYLAGAKYDRFFDEKWYGYVGADFEKNSFKDLDLRSIFSIGVGHQFWDTDAKRLSVEGGLSYIDEDFKRDSDDSYLALGWGVNYEQIFYDGAIKFFHHHRGLQGFKDI